MGELSQEPHLTPAPTILLVEDEAGMADLEREVLTHAGFDVHWVAEGRPALEHLLGSHRFALVVLDYRLPDMTGADVLARIGDQLEEPAVIVVTGYPDPEIEKRMRAAGVYDYLRKDVDLKFLDQLPKVARAAIEGRSR